MTLRTMAVASLILATIWSSIHGQDENNGNKSEDLQAQASDLGDGDYDVHNGELYGRYPGYYSGLGTGYYAPQNGLGTSGLGYNNVGYGGLGFPGFYPGYGGYGNLEGYGGNGNLGGYGGYRNLGGYGGYYNRPGQYQ